MLHHNAQVSRNGICTCRCHYGALICTCGLSKKWQEILRNFVYSKKPGKTKLESRVKAFSRSPSAKYNQRGAPISATSSHAFHAPRQGQMS